ncbi:hypothetical protein BDR22DRAFT_384322 [Usnea florida]
MCIILVLLYLGTPLVFMTRTPFPAPSSLCSFFGEYKGFKCGDVRIRAHLSFVCFLAQAHLGCDPLGPGIMEYRALLRDRSFGSGRVGKSVKATRVTRQGVRSSINM